MDKSASFRSQIAQCATGVGKKEATWSGPKGTLFKPGLPEGSGDFAPVRKWASYDNEGWLPKSEAVIAGVEPDRITDDLGERTRPRPLHFFQAGRARRCRAERGRSWWIPRIRHIDIQPPRSTPHALLELSEVLRIEVREGMAVVLFEASEGVRSDLSATHRVSRVVAASCIIIWPMAGGS